MLKSSRALQLLNYKKKTTRTHITSLSKLFCPKQIYLTLTQLSQSYLPMFQTLLLEPFLHQIELNYSKQNVWGTFCPITLCTKVMTSRKRFLKKPKDGFCRKRANYILIVGLKLQFVALRQLYRHTDSPKRYWQLKLVKINELFLIFRSVQQRRLRVDWALSYMSCKIDRVFVFVSVVLWKRAGRVVVQVI